MQKILATVLIVPLFWALVCGGRLFAAEAAPRDYLGPSALMASKDGQRLYVACADAREVAFLELPAGKVARRVTVPAEPTGLAILPDGSKLVVTCAASRSPIVILDAVSGELLATYPAGHSARAPVVTPDGKRLFVSNRFNNDVSVIDVLTGRESARLPMTREPIAAAMTPDGRKIVVANHLPNRRTDGKFANTVCPVVTIIDTGSGQTQDIELFNGSNGLRSVCITPDGKHAIVTHLLSNFQMMPFRVDMGWINTNVVSLIEIEQAKLVTSIGLDDYYLGAGNPWDVACSTDGTRVCVSLSGTHELALIDLEGLLSEYAHRSMSPMMGVWPIYPSLGESLWRRVPLPGKGPRGIAIAGSKVYVAEYFSDTLAVVDLHSPVKPAPGSLALGPTPQLSLERRGELLFHDASICYQQWQSCASCHPDGRADALTWDLMNDGAGNPKTTKSMLLSHVTPPSMAEGVRMSAEQAVRAGLTGILFTNQAEQYAVPIDAYLKALQPVASPYLVDGALSLAAERGQRLFNSERLGCAKCHPAPLYTDMKSHNVGSRAVIEYQERFDTPTLIEVWRTAPYLHDGRYVTMKELFTTGQHGSGHFKGEKPSDQEIDDLVEFVLSL